MKGKRWEGVFKKYYFNFSLKAEGEYKYGKKEGHVVKYFFDYTNSKIAGNGGIKFMGEYLNGKK